MSNQSPQSIAIITANDYLDIVDRVLALYWELKKLNVVTTDNAVATTLGKLETVAVLPDGSLSQVSDDQIDPAHPINPLRYPALSRPVSLTQLAQAKTILDSLVAFIDGQALSAQPGARGILNAVHGG